MKPLYFALSYILISSLSWAGTVTGQIQLSNGQALNNGTFSFTLSQAAIASGSASVATQSINCYTSNLGQVVGLPDPLVLPIVATNLSSGSLAAGTYYVKITYYMASGETLTSPELAVALSGSGSMIVSPPVLQPAAAVGYRVYISTTSQAETLQNSVVGFLSYTQGSALISGASLPTQNTVPCSLRFNDELIPSSTNYSVNLVNKNGSQVAGYPQRWFMAGGTAGTINVSQGTPLAIGQVIYPNAIVSNPILNAEQSVNSPLNLNGYGIKAGLAQLFNPLSSSQQYQLRIGQDSTDSGMYLLSQGTGVGNLLAGAAYNGTNYVAKSATAGIEAIDGGGFHFNFDTGLSAGSTYAQTKRFGIESQGNPALFMPYFPQGYTDWTNSGACTNLSVSNHGIICYDQAANTFKFSVNGGGFTSINGGATGYGLIKQNGASLAQQTTLNFITGTNAINCVDNPGSSRTDCSIFQGNSTVGNGANTWTLTANTGYGATGSNPTLQFGGGQTTLTTGAASNSAVGDSLSLVASGATGGNNTGGNVSLSTGAGSGSGGGGALNLTAGSGSAIAGTGGGGNVTISAGQGGATSGVGGVVTIAAGIGTGGNSLGGSVAVSAGSGHGTQAGGSITLTPGGGATNGSVTIVGQAGVPAGQSGAVGTAFNLTGNRWIYSENSDARGYFNVSGQSAFSGFCSGAATAGATLFLFNAGATAITCTDTTKVLSIPMPSAGILRNLRVVAGTAGVNGSSGVVTILNGAGATALTCTVGTGTTCFDTTHTATVAAGDLISIQFTTQGGETLANVRASFEKN